MKVFTVSVKPAGITGMALLVSIASLLFLSLSDRGYLPMLSEKDLIVAWQERAGGPDQAVYYLNYLPVSAKFYSAGMARQTDGGGTGLPQGSFWLAAHKDLAEISYWKCEPEFTPERGLFKLYYCEK